MLAGKEMVATIAVKDLATARKFYEGTLGLKVEDDKGTEAHTYRGAARASSSIGPSSRGRTRRPR